MQAGNSSPAQDPAPVFFIGQHETQRADALLEVLSRAQGLGYDFLTVQITTAAFHSRVVEQLTKHFETLSEQSDLYSVPLPIVSPLHLSDSSLTPQESNSALVAVVSPWIDLTSDDPIIANISRQVLHLEVAYASFCGINNMVLFGPTLDSDTVQFARAVREALGLGPFVQIHTLLPTSGELEQDYGDDFHLSELAREVCATGGGDPAEEHDEFTMWDTWNTIRTMCSYSQRLSIALELPRQLPTYDLLSRWYSEPVRLLVFPRTSFLRNAKGYPVLSKPHQQLLSRFTRASFPPWMLLSDVGPIPSDETSTDEGGPIEPTPAEAASTTKEKPKDPVPHLRYLRHLQQSQPVRSPIERFGQGYEDYLQSPLQPLTDNLESITYEVFEKDPIKYEWYERAIAGALKDLNEKVRDTRRIIIGIVGAGRGPLVTRALQASQQSGVAVDCWAVEKNPNAFVLLRRRNATDPLWNGHVNIVKSDMRHWSGPTVSDTVTKVDIFVSELLGSFADNELSPECLDGVQHVLHPDHGISIPQSYTAHLTPISTPRLHSDLLGRSGSEKWELPYVVMLHQLDYLCCETKPDGAKTPQVQQAWSFSHPVPTAILDQARARAGGSLGGDGWVGGDGSNEHNSRICRLGFACENQGVCHGLAGYFETVLYASSDGKTELSTNPVTMDEKSKDMISWFPIFFPLKTPLHVPANSQIEVSMWRQTDDRSVWYEWMIEVFEASNGLKRRFAMTDLHSSRKNGCVM